MIGRRKKQPPVQRTPHISRSQQSTFHYSSNRSAADHTNRDKSGGEAINSKRSRKNRIRLQAPYVFGLIIVVVASVYASTLTANPQVVVAGEQPLRDQQQYSQVAAESVGGSPLRYSKFTINRQKIADDLQSQFPELANIKVSTSVFDRSAVVIAESSRPAALLATNTGSYVLDTRGVALFDVRKDRPAIKTDGMVVINDQTGVPIQIGKPAIAATQIGFITEVKRQSEAKKLPIESMSLSAGGGELNVNHTDLKYFVKYNLYEDPRKSFGTFIATKEYIDRTKVTPAEYIDVRVAERAYIK